MSDYRMDIDGSIGLSDYSNIHDYLGVVDIDYNFTINLNNNGNTEINIINSILKNNCFCIWKEEYDNEGTYHIYAYKLK